MTDGIGSQPSSQIPTTTDLLSPNKFKVVISRFPNVTYFAQRVPIPTVTLGQSLYFTNQESDIKWPGDKLEYDDLFVSFIVDEDLSSLAEIIHWIQEAASSEKEDIFSDLTVITLTNNSNNNKRFKFFNCWPQTVSNVILDTTQSEDMPLTADVMFKFSHFTLT